MAGPQTSETSSDGASKLSDEAPLATTHSQLPTPAVGSGWKTTEFWLTVALHVLNAVVAAELIADSSPWAKILAIASSTLAQVLYLSGRTTLKRDAIELQAERLRARNLFGLALLPLLILGSFGCRNALKTPSAYVAADRATYEAIAPEYRGYVAADEALDDEQKARRERTLATWELRIRSAEGTEAKRH